MSFWGHSYIRAARSASFLALDHDAKYSLPRIIRPLCRYRRVWFLLLACQERALLCWAIHYRYRSLSFRLWVISELESPFQRQLCLVRGLRLVYNVSHRASVSLSGPHAWRMSLVYPIWANDLADCDDDVAGCVGRWISHVQHLAVVPSDPFYSYHSDIIPVLPPCDSLRYLHEFWRSGSLWFVCWNCVSLNTSKEVRIKHPNYAVDGNSSENIIW